MLLVSPLLELQNPPNPTLRLSVFATRVSLGLVPPFTAILGDLGAHGWVVVNTVGLYLP